MKIRKILFWFILGLVLVASGFGFGKLYDHALVYRERTSVPEINVLLNGEGQEFSITDREWKYSDFFEKNIIVKNLDNKIHEQDTLIEIISENCGIDISFSNDIYAMDLEIYNKMNDVFTARKTNLLSGSLPVPENNGIYEYNIQAYWNNPEKGYEGSATIEFIVYVRLPITFELSSDRVVQGELITIKSRGITNSDDVQITKSFYNDHRWHEGEDYKVTKIPTNYHTETGKHEIIIEDVFHNIEHSFEIEVSDREYKVQNLYIDPNIDQATRNKEAYEEFEKRFTPVRKTSSPIRFYSEEFVLPTSGRISTEFGEKRRVNDELTTYRHNGIDIAVPLGTDILAANYGEVVFADHLILTGNSIVIDHGHGLFSVYYHLHEIHVEEGDFVDAGQLIGLVGSTGFSTGPHLHLTMSYYDIPLEPGYFIYNEPFFK